MLWTTVFHSEAHDMKGFLFLKLHHPKRVDQQIESQVKWEMDHDQNLLENTGPGFKYFKIQQTKKKFYVRKYFF